MIKDKYNIRIYNEIPSGKNLNIKIRKTIFKGNLYTSNLLDGYKVPKLTSLGELIKKSAIIQSNLGKLIINSENVFTSFAANYMKNLEIINKTFIRSFIGVQSIFLDWMKSIDYSSLFKQIAEVGQEYILDIRSNYFDLMYECKWFPYIGLDVDFKILWDIADIAKTSRGKSKRREKRIDKVILEYYDDKQIKLIKSSWNKLDIDSPIKRIMKQSLDAHIRGEYALCISSLATLWECLITLKSRNIDFEDREAIKTVKTKQNFQKLIKKNKYDQIFSDYFNHFIFSQCKKVNDVVEGVPNRHGIAHGWYKKYPNKKASLNAILLTEFITKLE